MSPISIPGKVTLQMQYSTVVSDPDATAYLQAVEAADGQTLEIGVAQAVNNFVVGCKADGTWSAIKASCILAGARTLAGALVPLVGTAPTNNNFVAGDYDRETGLAGDGSTKYIDTNRDNDADPQNNNHAAVFVTEGITSPALAQVFMGAIGGTGSITRFLQNTNGDLNAKANDASSLYTVVLSQGVTTGLKGVSRLDPASYSIRTGGANYTGTKASASPSSTRLSVFRRTDNTQYLDARLSFYSIGESLDLALLDARVTTLMSDIGAAIP